MMSVEQVEEVQVPPIMEVMGLLLIHVPPEPEVSVVQQPAAMVAMAVDLPDITFSIRGRLDCLVLHWAAAEVVP
jgi:hypothetical protein